MLMSVVEIGPAPDEPGVCEGFQLLAAVIGVEAREIVVGADAGTCRSNVELDEDDCDLATWYISWGA